MILDLPPRWIYKAPGSCLVHACDVPHRTLCGQDAMQMNDYYNSWPETNVSVCETCWLWAIVSEMA